MPCFFEIGELAFGVAIGGCEGKQEKESRRPRELARVAHEFEREGLLFTGTGSWQTGANYPHQALKEGRKEGLFCICVGSRNLNLNWELLAH